MDLSRRSSKEEFMDDPNLDKESFKNAYADINRCNKWLGGNNITINAVQELVQKHPKKSYTIYDMGCGDGQMLRKLSQVLEKQNVEFELVGYDLRDDVLELAREASAINAKISFEKADILAISAVNSCDIVLCTLTMHHFPEEKVHSLVQKLGNLARLGVVINDLHRNRMAYHLFKLFSLFFIRTKIAKADGLISIRKGFRKAELHKLASTLDHFYHSIHWKWAFRYLWILEPVGKN